MPYTATIIQYYELFRICLCPDLSGVWIGYNHIRKIPRRICEAKKLRILDIEFNKVNEIPSCVKRKEVLTIHSQGNSIGQTLLKFEQNGEDGDSCKTV